MSDRDQRTEAPTAKRKREARRDGRVPRTAELASAASLFVGSVLMGRVVSNGDARLRRLVERVAAAIERPDERAALGLLGDGLKDGLMIVAQLVLGLVAVGLLCNLAQVGLFFSGKLVKPDIKRINPMKGLKRLASPASLAEAGKSLGKVSVLALLAARSLGQVVPAIAASGMSLLGVLPTAGQAAVSFTRDAAALALVVALADYLHQRRRIGRDLRMTRQEVKDEHKQAEGDPHVKGAIRERQARMSRMRMMAEVAKADVVLVNPTHVAVAIRYDPERGAPRVVAKGAGAVARRIRAEAEAHEVAMIQDVPLARALYQGCDIGQEIPLALYEAVARVLALLFALKARGPVRGIHQMPVAVAF